MAESGKSDADNGGNPARYVLIAAAAIATFSIGYAIARGDDQGAAESGAPQATVQAENLGNAELALSLIHISEPTRRTIPSRMPSSA